jgi:hypothetical protein
LFAKLSRIIRNQLLTTLLTPGTHFSASISQYLSLFPIHLQVKMNRNLSVLKSKQLYNLKWFALWLDMFFNTIVNEVEITNHTQTIHKVYTKYTQSIHQVYYRAYFESIFYKLQAMLITGVSLRF